MIPDQQLSKGLEEAYVRPAQMLTLPEHVMPPFQRRLYNNIMLFVEANVYHALNAGLNVDADQGEKLHIELRIGADTSEMIEGRFVIEVTLP